MKFPQEEKLNKAMREWMDAEIENYKSRATDDVMIEILTSPDMTPIEQLAFFSLRKCGFKVEPQKNIGKYRVDFLYEQRIEDGNSGNSRIIIECDGHDFHERTKDQSQRDKTRDRDLQSLGFRVYRFTGSEIWKSNGMCIVEQLLKDY